MRIINKKRKKFEKQKTIQKRKLKQQIMEGLSSSDELLNKVIQVQINIIMNQQNKFENKTVTFH